MLLASLAFCLLDFHLEQQKVAFSLCELQRIVCVCVCGVCVVCVCVVCGVCVCVCGVCCVCVLCLCLL